MTEGSGLKAQGELTARGAWVDGMRRVNTAPVILACAFIVTLLTALPLSVVLRDSIRASLGNSLAADEALHGVNYLWWTDYSAAQPSGSIAQTFGPSVIGFAVLLDNISAVLDKNARPAGLLMLGAAYLLLWLFLAGGILDRYARNRPTRAHEFFTACGIYFVRFLRLAPLIGVTYYVLFRYVHSWLFDGLYEAVTGDLAVERTAFFWRLGFYAVFGLMLITANVIFDYAKARAVIEDRRSMIGAVSAALRFVRRNPGAVAGLYALDALLFLAVAALYLLVAPGAGSSGVLMWLGFLVSQLYLLARLWVRLVFFASSVALFQGRLAHVGYVAGAPISLPEPPIVEHALSHLSPEP
jgi:hypothetical protein